MVIGFNDDENSRAFDKYQNSFSFEHCYDFIREEIVRIIFESSKIKEFCESKFDQNKNLLFLDWDETLYTLYPCGQPRDHQPRPHLFEFLQFCCQRFNVMINTACKCESVDTNRIVPRALQLNNNSEFDINISGIIHANKHKDELNCKIREHGWLGVDVKLNNFLLIDDQPSVDAGYNGIRIPHISIRDDQTFPILMKWLERWDEATRNQSNTVSTPQLIQSQLGQAFTLNDFL